MFEKTTLARPYAKAVFEIAKTTQSFQQWSKGLSILSVIAQDKRVVVLLRDRSVSTKKMADFFLKVSEKNVDKSFRNFITTLAYHRRLNVLPEIQSLYEELRRKESNMMDVELSVPHSIEEPEKKKFETLLEKYFSKTVNVTFKVDKSLLGGFIARAGNDVIDGSLRRNLGSLKEAMGGESLWD